MTAAKSTKSNAKNYAELEAELQAIITWFEGDNFDVDQAVRKYERGLELVKQLEKYLGAAENTVRQLKAKFKTRAK
jgi:exodeoxyribonuclease VII small subunit